MNPGARALLALVWLLHVLPLPLLAALGGALGGLLWHAAPARRRIALTNLALCFADKSSAERRALARAHFGWLGRSIVERALLWHASRRRLERLIQVEGDIGFAERCRRPVMWLVPHFLALDAAGAATPLFQRRRVVSVYQPQSNAVLDAAIRRGRLRFGGGEIHPRQRGALPLVRAIKAGAVFFNLPDMDFGARDAAFVPFFGVPAATLLAPSRLAHGLDMAVQPVLAEMLPRGQGWRVRFLEPWADWPSADPVADMRRMNAWIEAEVRCNPAQYLWVHRRFKTRPAGAPSPYAAAAGAE